MGKKVRVLRMTTLDAAKEITETLDFVYVDARHDYCGVNEDIQAYWPKLKPGGIMAGHDYLNADEVCPACGRCSGCMRCAGCEDLVLLLLDFAPRYQCIVSAAAHSRMVLQRFNASQLQTRHQKQR